MAAGGFWQPPLDAARIRRYAGGISLSEWVRDVVMREVRTSVQPDDAPLFGEIAGICAHRGLDASKYSCESP
jgi:hypothetical protein